jgi:hypothetical protein
VRKPGVIKFSIMYSTSTCHKPKRQARSEKASEDGLKGQGLCTAHAIYGIPHGQHGRIDEVLDREGGTGVRMLAGAEAAGVAAEVAGRLGRRVLGEEGGVDHGLCAHMIGAEDIAGLRGHP